MERLRYGTFAVRKSVNGTERLRYGIRGRALRYETVAVRNPVNGTEALRYAMDSVNGMDFDERYGTLAVLNVRGTEFR